MAAEFRLAVSEVVETASFYAHFRLLEEGEAAPKATLRVCGGPACRMRGADQLHSALTGMGESSLRVEEAPCIGLCDHAPAALAGRVPVRGASLDAVRSALTGPPPNRPQPIPHDFRVWRRCVDGILSREAALAGLEASGLRGMGGAGFPAARKWRMVAALPGPRLVVVNADEGEPGTFKDRHFIETAPDRVLEGALVAAWVTDAEAIYLYLRDEYPDLHALLSERIKALPEGAPPIHLRRGAGAYVCGEESALIESLEGKRGLPRQRPPYVAEAGLFGRPTLVNNVETLYWVSRLLDEGAGLFTSRGRNGHSGLRSYSVSGRVRSPGVKIAPNGLTIAELIDEYCDGMEDGHHLVAYLPGGASGGFLPAHIRPPLAFGAIEEHGGFIGSAAVVVFSQADDLRQIARDLARFFAHESCGQCTPCRLGTVRAADIMERPAWDLARLDDLAHVMREASICGLGQAAPNVWQSLIRHFPEFAS
ncbi:NADH-quinone oxidoreductase subunit F [Paramagnetospirillum marisnigri]|uniref:NADH-quinone oxidoreductase subunit F n=1 Tax=Paramagnetospirillum marisnigri TaxID=1285242 RepID=A0A178MUH4_9PROT|nr:NADH-quinone oxidoreductase subunit F [Paramagnetospirillum marisnigri]